MAPGVAKSFIKELYKVMSIRYPECSEDNGALTKGEHLTNEGIKDILKTYREKHRLILDNLDYVKRLIRSKYCKTLSSDEVNSLVDTALKLTDDDTHQAMEAVVHNLNSMHSRAGAQVPFSSINFGTDTSAEGRMASFNLLKATDEGLGNGETPIFPISIFKMKSGISYNREDPNYDLFKESMRVSAKRLFPNFSNLDAPYNLQYYKPGDRDTEIAYMGCAAGIETITFRLNGEQINCNLEQAWKELSSKFEVKKYGMSEYVEPVGMTILDDSSNHTFVQCKKFIRNPNRNNWNEVSLMGDDFSIIRLTVTEDHPFAVAGKGRVFTKDLQEGDYLALADTLKPIRILKILSIDVNESALDLSHSYDVETASDRFTLSGVISHNCRTRVMANVYDPTYEKVTGRGNLSFTSINLPRLGIKAHGDIDRFFELLNSMMDLVHHQLLNRFEVQCRKHPRNYPFLMGQGIWKDSEKLNPDDDIREILKHGTLTVGFIGLAECLKALIGKHHGESEEAQELGLKIVGHMREMTDKWSEEEHMNYSVIATPAEGLSGRFIRIDKKKYGIIPGVTDRDYYTNSFHIPVYYPISAFKKIRLEAPYHALCNGGHISYIELDGDPSKNLEAFERVVRYMHDQGIGYGAINHPVDRDPVCNYSGIIDDVCPRCGRREGEPMTEEMWQKIKGYPSWANSDHCGYCGDIFEESDRITNPLTISEDK